MIKRFYLLLLISSLLLFGCKGIVEQDFFFQRLSTTEYESVKEKELNDSFITSSMIPMSIIVDSLMISIDRLKQDFIFSISNIQNDSLLGTFCRRGRSNNEIVDCLPIMSTYSNSIGELCAPIFTYGDGRILIWNITQSLDAGSHIYENIIQLHNEENWYPFLSGYLLCEKSVIVRNSKQIGSSDTPVNAPRYEVYSTSTGELIRQYDIFKPVVFETNNPIYTSNSFLGCTDCIKPDRTKIAIGMGYMPVYGILDLHSGSFKGFQINNLIPFRPTERIWHFCDMVADNQLIYALYYGGDISEYDSKRHSSTLFVLDWEGRIKARYSLDKYVTELNLSNGILYLSYIGDAVYMLNTINL